MSVMFKPFSMIPEIGDCLFNQEPKGSGMVAFPDMGQFMNRDIINDFQGSHDQSPAKVQVTSGVAGTPSFLGIGDLQLSAMDAGEALVAGNPFFEHFQSLLAVPGQKQFPGPGLIFRIDEKSVLLETEWRMWGFKMGQRVFVSQE